MSEITPDVVRHLASLARIGLDEQEVERLTSQLGAIVDAVATVGEVATPDIPATSHPLPLGTVTRADVPGATLTPEQALAGAPEREGDYFKVSSILGEEQ